MRYKTILALTVLSLALCGYSPSVKEKPKLNPSEEAIAKEYYWKGVDEGRLTCLLEIHQCPKCSHRFYRESEYQKFKEVIHRNISKEYENRTK